MSVENDESLLPKNRVEALCDGIFAIAMTIIVFELKTPDKIPLNLENDKLPQVLLDLLPEIEAYIISFIVLAIFWLRHQIQFKFLKFLDRKVLVINVFFLLLIVFVPFSVGLIMRFENSQLALAVYIINLLLISAMLSLQGWYIKNNKKLLFEEVSEEIINRFILMANVTLIIFTLSLIVSFINVRIAFLIIYLDPIFYFVFKTYIKRASKRKTKVN